MAYLVTTRRPAEAIACTGPNNGNCLHAAIRRQESYIKYLLHWCDESSIMAQDEDGNTPLHYAVDAEYSTSQQFDLVQSLLAKCPGAAIVMNKLNLSAYQVSKRSWAKWDQRQAGVQEDFPVPTREEETTSDLGQKLQQSLKTTILRQQCDIDTWLKVLYNKGEGAYKNYTPAKYYKLHSTHLYHTLC